MPLDSGTKRRADQRQSVRSITNSATCTMKALLLNQDMITGERDDDYGVKTVCLGLIIVILIIVGRRSSVVSSSSLCALRAKDDTFRWACAFMVSLS